MNNKREQLVNELMEQINEDMKALLKAEDKALDSNRSEDFINIAKRIDKLGALKVALHGYPISMKGFDWLVENGKY